MGKSKKDNLPSRPASAGDEEVLDRIARRDAEAAPVQSSPEAVAAPAGLPVTKKPAAGAPVRKAPAREAPAQEAPPREAPAQEAPPREAPVREGPAGGDRGPIRIIWCRTCPGCRLAIQVAVVAGLIALAWLLVWLAR